VAGRPVGKSPDSPEVLAPSSALLTADGSGAASATTGSRLGSGQTLTRPDL